MSPPLVPGAIAGMSRALRDGDLRAGDLVDSAEAALSLVEGGADGINAFLSTDFERARQRASEMDDELRDDAEVSRPLAGIPVALKDNIVTTDHFTTCGSRILEGYRSPFDATAVRRLRDAGAVIIGKTNMDEFAMGSSTESSAYGPTRNPLDRQRVPGGSSGGSAAAVAAGIVPAALGSETGGSVRQPAAFCGVVGIKPTYGRVSRYGLVAFASSLDQIGTLGRTVDDAALLLETIAGADPYDATCAHRPVPPLAHPTEQGLEGVTVGVPEEYFPDSLDAGVRARCDEARRVMEALGATVREVSLPHTRFAIPAYYVIAPAEASSNLARFDGVRYGVRARGAVTVDDLYERSRALFGPEVKRRIMLGTFTLSAGHHDAYYGRARQARSRIAADFEKVFAGGVDLLLTPTAPTTPFRLGERTADPYEMYLADVFTVAASLSGLPALSLPVGAVEGLPVGGQLIGPRWSEATLVRAAREVESALALVPLTVA